MRRAASLGYLLARTSDTLADTSAASHAVRLAALESFTRAVASMTAPGPWPDELLGQVADPAEFELLAQAGHLFTLLRALPAGESALIREVVAIISSGQQLDLERFATATAEQPIALPDAAALDDYAWRVAGCVGEFWTRLGFLTLGARFSGLDPSSLLERGRNYGKGLQLVNILRDLPADLGCGRCYLPVADPTDHRVLLASMGPWCERAAGWVGQGTQYARSLRSRRLRAATHLPALLATETLDLLRVATWESLQVRIKVPRRRVYALLLRALF